MDSQANSHVMLVSSYSCIIIQKQVKEMGVHGCLFSLFRSQGTTLTFTATLLNVRVVYFCHLSVIKIDFLF